MATKPETVFKNRIRPHLDALPSSWWFKTQQVSLRGIPDFIGCLNGKFVALELKKDAKAPIGKLQIHILELIQSAGGYAAVVYPDNWESVLWDLKKISQPERY